MTFKNIWIFDDRADRSDGFEEDIQIFFPEASFEVFDGAYDFFIKFEDLTAENLPEVLIFDAYDHQSDLAGYKNLMKVVGTLKTKFPDYNPSYILFMSGDLRLSVKCQNRAQAEEMIPPEDIFSIEKSEVFKAQQLHKKRGPIRQEELYFGYTAFLNKALGLQLPINGEELTAYAVEHNMLEPMEVISMAMGNELALTAALKALNHQKDSDWLDYSEVPWEGLDYRTTRNHRQDSGRFHLMAGPCVQGIAVFDPEEAVALKREGKAPILITERFEHDWYEYIKHLSGLVVMQSEIPGHLQLIAEAHGVAILIAPFTGDDVIKEHEFVSFKQPDKPLTKILFKDGKPLLRTIYGAIAEEIETFRERWDQGYGVGPGRKLELDKKKLLMNGISINAGDEVTLNTGYKTGDIYKGHIHIEPSRVYEFVEYVEGLFRKAADQYCRPVLHFKSNVDTLEQVRDAYMRSPEGIGLVRTEHLAFTDKASFQALHAIFTESSDQANAYQTLAERQAEQMHALFDAIQEARMLGYRPNPLYPVRIRLLDAPPSEVLSPAELLDLDQKIAPEDQRGAQLGLLKPDLYSNQLDAIFAAHKAFVEKPLPKNDWDVFELPALEGEKEEEPYEQKAKIKLEIMVPTIRTLEELLAIKQMTAAAAQRLGLSENDYAFGMMLETLEAANNIQSLVPHVDFVSIGSNDLTSEVLGISRGDLDARMKIITQTDKKVDPFVQLDPRVLEVIKKAVQQIRSINKKMDISLCGAHAADFTTLKSLRPLRLTSISLPPKIRNHDALAADWFLYDFKQWWNRREGQLRRHKPAALAA
ncbi:MAG: putative PEP-binding protein [Alphaproteobacteria bacterium]